MLNIGDYVLATKHKDGDPKDPWVIGLYSSMHTDGERYIVSLPDGNFDVFRRAKNISQERGKWLLEHKDIINNGWRSIWWWANLPIDDAPIQI